MRRAVGNRFVQVHIDIANIDFESAIGVAAYPSFIVNWRPLTAEVRQGEQTALRTYFAFRPSLLHGILLNNNYLRDSCDRVIVFIVLLQAVVKQAY